MSNRVISYEPGATTVVVDGQICDIEQARFEPHKGFRIDPIIYAGETEIKWWVSFSAGHATDYGHSAKGLSEANITMETIRAVLEVFLNLFYMREGQEVDLIVSRRGEPPIIALGNQHGGQAVVFRDHLR